MTAQERALLIEQAASAHRDRDPRDGRAQTHPGWRDLGDAVRAEGFDLAARARTLEAALDPAGLSTTARAVLARIRR